MKPVRSYDVFDTCLARRAAEPSLLFYETSRRVCERLGLSPTPSMVENLAAARLQAEKLARQQASLEDITLDSIWRNAAAAMGLQPDARMAQCEMEVESESLFPIASIRAELQRARQQGCRIVFISDMYLPAAFIQQQLTRHGFAQPGDGVYVSSEIGKSKATGNLFRHVLAAEKIGPSQIVHTGDNQHSDYTVPQALGIESVLFSQTASTPAELTLLQSSRNAALASHTVAAMREFRLAAPLHASAEVNHLVSQLLGPFVLGFASWVLQRASEDGIRRLYFVSRDCQLTWKVAQVLAPHFGNIECRYLYASRQALFLPAVSTISPEGMPWMRRSFEQPNLDSLLAKLDLTFQQVEPALRQLAGDRRGSFCPASAADWQQFWAALNEPLVAERIHAVIQTRRNAALQYFSAAGLFDPIPWAIVDLGWYLTCQQSLGKLLQSAGRQNPVQGYYAAIYHRRVAPASAGPSQALVYEPIAPSVASNEVAELFARQTLIEHIVGCADHPSVQRYRDTEPGPVFTSAAVQSNPQFVDAIHEETVRFARQNIALAQSLAAAGASAEILPALAAEFFRRPTPRSVAAIAQISAASDQNSLDTAPLVRPLTLRTARVHHRQNHSLFWNEGTLAASHPIPRGVVRLLQGIRAVRRKLAARLHRTGK